MTLELLKHILTGRSIFVTKIWNGKTKNSRGIKPKIAEGSIYLIDKISLFRDHILDEHDLEILNLVLESDSLYDGGDADEA